MAEALRESLKKHYPNLDFTVLVTDRCDSEKRKAASRLPARVLFADDLGIPFLDLLREWYADCEGILKPLGAVIDKFIGDGVFAYWPATDQETRLRAAEAASLLSSAEASHSATRKWLRENKGITVQCNVGLNIGPVALGAMGRGVNTAVGEAVNLTFRIESLTRKLEQPVLVSAAFVDGMEGAQSMFEPAGTHSVKGQPEPVEVYALRSV